VGTLPTTGNRCSEGNDWPTSGRAVTSQREATAGTVTVEVGSLTTWCDGQATPATVVVTEQDSAATMSVRVTDETVSATA
jgi:hypothetical protein